MINNIQSNNNYSVSFKGIPTKTIQRFIPEMSEDAAEQLSKYFSLELPKDEFKYIEKETNNFMHLKEILPGMKFPIGEVSYVGTGSKIDKLTFLHKLVEQIKTNTLYNK